MSKLAWGRGFMRLLEGSLLVLATLGCLGPFFERSYGIVRKVTLTRMPDFNCMRRALEEVEGVRVTNEYHYDIPATPGHPSRFSLHTFSYEGEEQGAQAELSVGRTREEVLQLRNDRLTHNERPPAAAILSTRRLMLKVEQRLAEECGMIELANVKEECRRVDCDE